MARAMTIDKLRQGSVIHYPYLWHHQINETLNPKDRPACIVLKLDLGQGRTRFAIAPISDQEPSNPAAAVEVPVHELERGGLGVHRRAFVHLTEVNIDETYNSFSLHSLMPVKGRFGAAFVKVISTRLIENLKMKRTVLVSRKEK